MALTLKLTERLTIGGETYLDFDTQERGEVVGTLALLKEGDNLEVQNVNFTVFDKEEEALKSYEPGSQKLRDLLRLIKRLFPDVKTMTGQRMSGARADVDIDAQFTEMQI